MSKGRKNVDTLSPSHYIPQIYFAFFGFIHSSHEHDTHISPHTKMKKYAKVWW